MENKDKLKAIVICDPARQEEVKKELAPAIKAMLEIINKVIERNNMPGNDGHIKKLNDEINLLKSQICTLKMEKDELRNNLQPVGNLKRSIEQYRQISKVATDCKEMIDTLLTENEQLQQKITQQDEIIQRLAARTKQLRQKQQEE
jgi:predicted RNase H-like nuclease (RuvC/YqgF family)